MTDDDTTGSLTPEEIEKRARTLLPSDGTVEAGDDVDTPLTALLTPESRFRIIAALIEANHDPLKISRLCEIAGVSKASFARHEDDLLDVGVMKEVDKVGNARRFALNEAPAGTRGAGRQRRHRAPGVVNDLFYNSLTSPAVSPRSRREPTPKHSTVERVVCTIRPWLESTILAMS